jgi:hypothetical protein
MKNESNKVEIYRLDVTKGPSIVGGYSSMPSLNNTSEIENINEVQTIIITGDIDTLFNEMPKSYKFKKSKFRDMNNEIVNGISVTFNTFWMDNTTGESNETAMKLRLKVIAKLQKLGY